MGRHTVVFGHGVVAKLNVVDLAANVALFSTVQGVDVGVRRLLPICGRFELVSSRLNGSGKT